MNAIYANRGRSLEELIIYANKQYQTKGLALIQKISTPWTVIRKGKQIVSAFPAEKSTVDFVGVAGGKAVAFDVKQCRNKTSFPLANIEPHQVEFLQEWERQGGEAFILIEMVAIGKIFKLSLETINYYLAVATEGGSKSIKVKQLIEQEHEVRQYGGIVLDYLGLMGGNRDENPLFKNNS